MANPTKARAELRAITAELTPLEERRLQLRDRAAVLVTQLLKAGVPPSEVTEDSPFSGAHVRTLARVAGLPPARRGRAAREAKTGR